MRPLPRGRHGLAPEFVAQNQRRRLLAAIAECLDERGYEKTTVSLISGRAHVSKSDFYRRFPSKDGCFLAAYDDAVERLRAEARTACAERGEWAEGVCAGLAAALAYLAREPGRASLLLVEGLRAGRGIYDRFLTALRSLASDFRDGAPAAADSTPEGVDEAVVGGIASLLARRVLAGEAERLEGLLPDIAEFALTPYLGAAEARRIISSR